MYGGVLQHGAFYGGEMPYRQGASMNFLAMLRQIFSIPVRGSGLLNLFFRPAGKQRLLCEMERTLQCVPAG
jgi:hypothetical protein